MKKKFVSYLATQVEFPGDSFVSDTEKLGILQFRVESYGINPSWLKQVLRKIAALWKSHCRSKNYSVCDTLSKFRHGWTDRLLQLLLSKENQLRV